MAIGEAPRSVREGMIVQQIAAETLVYDERRQMAFCLNESSSVVWRLADGRRTIAQMSEVGSAELGAGMTEELVEFIVATLRKDGLIEAAGEDARPMVSRRVMLRRLGVGGALLLPVIAAIVAPTAAQAYNGCVDCSSSAAARAASARRAQQAASGPQN